MGPHPGCEMLGSTWPRHDNSPAPPGVFSLTERSDNKSLCLRSRAFPGTANASSGIRGFLAAPLPLLPGEVATLGWGQLSTGHLPAPATLPGETPLPGVGFVRVG